MPDDQTDLSPASPQAIVYRRGVEEFRGWSDLPGMFALLARAALAAFVAAAIVSLPLAFGSGALFILAQFVEGIFLGMGLSRVFRSARLRNRSIAAQAFVFSVLIALILPQAAIYVHDTYLLSRKTMALYGLSFIRAYRGAYQFQSAFLVLKTGYGGLLGSILYHLQNQTYAGFVIVQMIITIFIAWKIASRQLASPFCGSCGNWMRVPINAAVVHVDLGDFLVEAVKTCDVEKALAVVRTAANVPLGVGCVVARLFRCKTCDSQMVDVIRKGFSRRGNKEAVILKPVVAPREFVIALRSDPVVAVEADAEPDSDAGDEAPDPA